MSGPAEDVDPLTGRPKASGGVNVPFFKLWALLRPDLGSILKGEWEIVPFMGVCLARALEVRLTTEVVRSLDSCLASRSIASFKAAITWGACVSMFGAWLSMIYNYLKSRISWKWRNKLVSQLHDRYFSGMAYYLVSEGGAPETRMSDPDTRLTDDLNRAVDGFAETFCNVIYTALAGFFHTAELWRLFGWKMGLAPYVYVVTAFMFTDHITPVMKTWRPLGRERGRTWGVYCNAQMKLIEKAESVAALNGGVREARLFCEQSTAVRVACYKQHVKFWQFGIVNQFFLNYMAQQLFPICIIGRGILYPKYKSIETIDQMIETRSDVGVQWVLFSKVYESASTIVESIRTMQRLVGDVERVTELIDCLDSVLDTTKMQASHTTKHGDCIAFDGVDIRTPVGVPLVNNLSFKLERGQSLLLCGHNGAGKSSIFRTLGGLWSVAGGGTITKPAEHAKNFFYIPQKPYNVLGTLADQMTYPDVRGAADLTREKLHSLLRAVDLEYLLDRSGALTEEINWEDELSLGEKQRLAIARLLHHKPQYAILDECSSAISDAMTRKLYQIVNEHNVTYITIAHRPALKAYHERILEIGDGKQGFTLTDITPEERAAAQAVVDAEAERGGDDEDVELRKLLRERSRPYAAVDQGNKEGKDLPTRGFFVRIWRLVKVGWIDFLIPRLCMSFGCVALLIYLQEWQMEQQGKMLGCLMRVDKGGMVKLARNVIVGALVQPVAWETLLFFQREIGHDMMERAQDYVMERLLRHNNFYKLSTVDGRIKDTKQRICGDCHEIFHHFDSMVMDGVVSMVKLVYYSIRIGHLLDRRFPLAMWAYFATSWCVLKLAMPDLATMHSKLSSLEHKFRFVHSRLRMSAESVAFFGGGERERAIADSRFATFMDQRWLVDWSNFKFGFIRQVFQDQIPWVWFWTLRFSYGVMHGGSDADMLADKGQKVNMGQQYVGSMCNEVFPALGSMIGMVQQVAYLTGKTARVSELLEVLDELDAEAGHTSGSEADKQWNYAHAEMTRVGSTLNNSDAAVPSEVPVSGPIPASWSPRFGSFGSQTAQSSVAKDRAGGNYVTAGTWWQRLRDEGPQQPQNTSAGESFLRFEDVDIVTPRGDALCTNVNLTITQASPLMITGQNASGKTSFVRLLSGLWPARKGTVTRQADVFCVPQRIYMTLGTLAEQVTYPQTIMKQDRTPEVEEHLQKLLDTVGIGYLVSRWGGDADDVVAKDHKGWDHVATWEDVLSLGEQQRLGMARLFYHKPTFALLDECTSAVSIDQERKLYEAAKELGISCVTISQRLSLPEYHAQELKLGQLAPDGFKLETITVAAREI